MYLTIIFLPLVGCFFSGFFGRFLSPKGSAFITILGIFIAFIFSLVAFFEVGLSLCPCYIQLLPWIDCELFDASWGFMFDTISVGMCVTVTFISLLVHIYSTSYMSHDPHQPRFMAYLSLFTFFMLCLVTADNFIQLFLGWEGVGLCSYLLINFWFTRLQANKAAIKAMIINRIGDVGLALGVFAAFIVFKTTNFSVIFSLVPYYVNHEIFFFTYKCNAITLIGLLLFIGSVGKSAQLGLHTWLPDAMEGPTPVSALIHAATMVTAGVFLIIRCSPLYEYSESALFIIVIFGALTAFFAATIGLLQNDLKKIIAYSTCSQLGYMVFACGLSSYSVSMFHLVNHAYFKALLFLSAGSVIHALNNEQDMRRMGGLLQVLPFTYCMFVVGSLALMGFPFLTGFYSKDAILEIAYAKYNFIGTFAHWLGIISAFFTAFYSFRLIYFTFVISPNGYKTNMQNAHDAPLLMGLPLFLLSVASIFIGYLTRDLYIGLGTPFWNNAIYTAPQNLSYIDAEFIPTSIKWLPVIFSLLGAILSIFLYHNCKQILYNLTSISLFRYIYAFLNRRWLFDRLQNDFIGDSFLKIGYSITYKKLDKGIIEVIGPKGIINLTTNIGKQVISLQSGLIHQYASLIFVGVIFIVIKITNFNFFHPFIDIHVYFLFIIGLLFTNFFYVKTKTSSK
uniref:NADH-ubiquinone oxidoreductase chain 5 n=1 Tax=Proteomonas sulcata TaxID=77928 RepID=A0A2P1G8B6_9CRYP|nr:NADH dehydrogenase subunit 5 [Proteomonas sulcata]AVM81205.1 NADH dehydrogenase subunit 5 [Proteomonas sulcata]